MGEREAVSSADAPAAAGPYSQAIRHGQTLYCSGALPIDQETGAIVDSSLAEETEHCLRNLASICREAGADLEDAVRLSVYTTDLGSFDEINSAYAEFFPDQPPARIAVGVAALPKNARVEIDAVVALGVG
jgi:2-iminobutanoate/2-iminopropanoate deaminase